MPIAHRNAGHSDVEFVPLQPDRMAADGTPLYAMHFGQFWDDPKERSNIVNARSRFFEVFREVEREIARPVVWVTPR